MHDAGVEKCCTDSWVTVYSLACTYYWKPTMYAEYMHAARGREMLH